MKTYTTKTTTRQIRSKMLSGTFAPATRYTVIDTEGREYYESLNAESAAKWADAMNTDALRNDGLRTEEEARAAALS